MLMLPQWYANSVICYIFRLFVKSLSNRGINSDFHMFPTNKAVWDQVDGCANEDVEDLWKIEHWCILMPDNPLIKNNVKLSFYTTVRRPDPEQLANTSHTWLWRYALLIPSPSWKAKWTKNGSKPVSYVPLFSQFLEANKYWLHIAFYVHIWHIPSHLGWGDTWGPILRLWVNFNPSMDK